jgi:hypothetical protein
LGGAGKHLVGHPADDTLRQPGQRRTVAGGQCVVECGLHSNRIRVVAAGRRGGQGVCAVGDDEHTDGLCRVVELGAQPTALSQCRVGVKVSGVDAHLDTGV